MVTTRNTYPTLPFLDVIIGLIYFALLYFLVMLYGSITFCFVLSFQALKVFKDSSYSPNDWIGYKKKTSFGFLFKNRADEKSDIVWVIIN